jgi:hypothetical protein
MEKSPLAQIEMPLSTVLVGEFRADDGDCDEPDGDLDRMSVLQDLAARRIKVTAAATLMSLGRRQVFRLAKGYAQRGPEALVSRKRGRRSNRSYPADLRDAAISIIRALSGLWPDPGGREACGAS